MKLKKVAAICKRAGVFHLYDEHKESGEFRQWLGDGCAVYPLDGLPVLDEGNLCAMFDITEKQKEKLIIRRMEMPDGISLEDTEPGEGYLYDEWPTIEYENVAVKPLSTRDGMVFIQNGYLSPLSDMEDYLRLYERKDTAGRTYIVAKNGLEIVAAIMPIEKIEDSFVDKLEELVVRCRDALRVQEERERRRELAKELATADQTKLQEDEE